MKAKSFVRNLFGKAAMAISIFTLLIVGVMTSKVFAQDETDANWSLKGVIVKMKDGRELVGYVIKEPVPHCPTPDEDTILYTEVYLASKATGLEGKVFVTTESQKLRIKTEDIAKTIAVRRPLDGRIVDWELAAIHSPEAIKWVTIEKSKAFIDRFDDGYAGRLISYNREIGEQELDKLAEKIKQRIEKFGAGSWTSDEELAKAWAKEWSDIKRDLELRRVVMLEFFMDCC